MVAGALGEDPFSGHLYVFHNRRANLIKILYWDRSGWFPIDFLNGHQGFLQADAYSGNDRLFAGRDAGGDCVSRKQRKKLSTRKYPKG